MMDIFHKLQDSVVRAVQQQFDQSITAGDVLVQSTRKDFIGEYTVVTFPFTKSLKLSPEAIGQQLGTALVEGEDWIDDFNVVKGFLNLSLSNTYWTTVLNRLSSQRIIPVAEQEKPEKVLVEFASPNTNKPLHLGHIRNILLGWSMSRIFEATGHDVKRIQIINDRGIAICKSMLAWSKFGNGATPESTSTKPDHFVGQWYVHFEKAFREEYTSWQKTAGRKVFEDQNNGQDAETFFKAYKNDYFNKVSSLGTEAREMLRKWEAGDEETRTLWKRMNQWVYDGYDETYARLGVTFDKLYYESNTYLLGKDIIDDGLKRNVFYQKEDGSVWVDLENVGMDQKILLRSDGTSVYISQDLGTAQLRYQDFGTDRMIYVVADEQNYHFQALFETLKKLKAPYADGLHHLSYGMVDLPSGTMKTREGTVVDADDLMDEVFEEARKSAEERGEIAELSSEEIKETLHKISLAALKYFIIKVDPKRRMTFNPAESVDLQGQTGPYIQNAYVRTRSILRKSGEPPASCNTDYQMAVAERALIASLDAFGQTVQLAENQFNPGTIANYCYQLAKDYHRYYHEYRILNAESEDAKNFRLVLINHVAQTLQAGMDLLGIEMPERM